jgi:hypothetical protein
MSTVLACEHNQNSTNAHTCHGETYDCLVCACCGNCREDVDSDDYCLDCGGVDENATV